MLKLLLQFLKKILGKTLTKQIRPYGHGLKSYLAALFFGFPGKKMKKIAVTGTKGKTSTVILTGRLLNLLGVKTGYISTALISIDGQKEVLNQYKMTAIDSIVMQHLLKKMLYAGCQAVILEMSSEGLKQNRHFGLGKFEIGVFLNLFPEHLESHGSLAAYQQAKAILFQNLKSGAVFIANQLSPASQFMWQSIPNKIRKTIHHILINKNQAYQIKEVRPSSKTKKIELYQDIIIDGQNIPTQFMTDFEIENLYFAYQIVLNYLKFFSNQLSASQIAKIDQQKIFQQLSQLAGIPGRMEFVHQSQQLDVLVDYAHEPESMKLLLQTLAKWRQQNLYHKIIHLVSCDGAGRDDWKKPILGQLSYQYADLSVVTTDNYEAADNPHDIIELLSQTYPKKTLNKKYFCEINRRQAFILALNLAKQLSSQQKSAAKQKKAFKNSQKILIVSTGVGTEQGLTQPGRIMAWDERQVWRDLIKKHG